MTASSTIAAPLLRFFGVLYRPEQEFEHIGAKPIWLGSFVYLCAGKMVVEYLILIVVLGNIDNRSCNSIRNIENEGKPHSDIHLNYKRGVENRAFHVEQDHGSPISLKR